MSQPWHTLTAGETLERLGADAERGLSSAEVERRLAEHGPNELIDRGRVSPWRILLEQFTGVLVIMLIIAAGISMALGEIPDSIAILAIVVLNAILGFVQEYRAEKAMAALQRLAVPKIQVRRDGQVIELSSRDLVPGDIVLIEAGNFVPADARILQSASLSAQEAALTGESVPIHKSLEPLEDVDLPLGDRVNMVYMGTAVTFGHGEAVVVATGMQTQLGSIAQMIQSVEAEPTPLQRRLAQFGRGLAAAALAIIAIVFIAGYLRGEDVRELLMVSISLAVAAVPEGLPAIVTIALALGAQRMLKRQALIRKLPAVETLGSVTVICSDKTGTLTQNKMTVTVLDVAGNRVDLTERFDGSKGDSPNGEASRSLIERDATLALLVAGGALCNNASLKNEEGDPSEWEALGDPTEGALVIAAARMGLAKNQLERSLPRRGEIPFESERKRMTTVHETAKVSGKVIEALPKSPYIAITKGAIDALLEISVQVWEGGEAKPLGEEWRGRILKANEQLAGEGMRVLGIAIRPLDALPDNLSAENCERDLIFVGLVGMIDPARPEARNAVETCKRAGIRTIMITGDHPLTASYIARNLGIGDGETVVTGRQLAAFSKEQLAEMAEKTQIYARVSPEHKLGIVEALQSKGQIVAMTGDGVNDAPALKRADIGVAMGITGTDVSKEAASMVLLDDNFATIVAAVEEGRAIYDNILKFIRFLLPSNSGEILVMFIGPFLGIGLPLLPLQILWINLVTDGLPGLALTVEKPEPDTMTRPPVDPQEHIFRRGLGRHILWVGTVMGLVSLASGFWYWRAGDPIWQTMIFTTLTLSQMGHVLAIHTRESVFKVGIFSNRWLLGAIAVTIALQMLVVYAPFMNTIFHTLPLPPAALALSIALSTVVFWGVEIEKRLTSLASRQ